MPKAGAAARVMASTPEPVALGRMNFTGRSLWAQAAGIPLIAAVNAHVWFNNERRFNKEVMRGVSEKGNEVTVSDDEASNVVRGSYATACASRNWCTSVADNPSSSNNESVS